MSDHSLSSTVMRFGVVLGFVGAALIVLGPWIIENFGVGGVSASTTQLWGVAPVGMTVSTVYSLLVQFCVPFSAAMVGASLVMRHNEGARKTGSRAQRNIHGS